MEKFNQAETLRKKAGISYEEAKEVMERTDWDLMEAMIMLEREGVLKEDPVTEPLHKKAEEASDTRNPSKDKDMRKKEEKRMEYIKKGESLLSRLVNWIAKMIALGNENRIVMRKGDRKVLELPVTAAVLLMIFFNAFFWFVFILSLITGYSYTLLRKKDREQDQQDIEEAIRTADQINQHHRVNSFGEAL